MILYKHIGARSELVACAWLLSQGYEVYRNVSQSGLCDVIATKDGEILRIDIKTANGPNLPLLKPAQVDLGIKPLYVFPDGRCEIDFSEPRRRRVDVKCGNCSRTFRTSQDYPNCSECRVVFKMREKRAAQLDARVTTSG